MNYSNINKKLNWLKPTQHSGGSNPFITADSAP